MFGIFQIRDWDLMCAPGSLHRLAVHEFWPGPTFRCAKNAHRPARPLYGPRTGTRRTLDLVNFRDDLIKRAGKSLMHVGWNIAFHEMRLIAVTADEVGQFPAADAGEHGRI